MDEIFILKIKYNLIQEKAHPRTIITHEYGHHWKRVVFRCPNMSLIFWKVKFQIHENKSTHDMSANERKADINAIRYNLYKAGLLTLLQGKYKTPSGKFEPSLLEKTEWLFYKKIARDLFRQRPKYAYEYYSTK